MQAHLAENEGQPEALLEWVEGVLEIHITVKFESCSNKKVISPLAGITDKVQDGEKRNKLCLGGI